MRIAIAGLGIIGASLARALKHNTDHTVDGWNRNHKIVEIALERGYIHGEVKDFRDYDVVFVAIPPKATMDFLDTCHVKDNAIVADICGMKKAIANTVYAKERNYRYVGTHPMAGKETAGIESSSETLYKNANIVLIEDEKTDKEALETVKGLYLAMGAGELVICSADYHDAKIAYTSQLPHVVSNAFVKSATCENCETFTGGSFQDMTRVAALNEDTWTELFFLNKDKLKEEIDGLVDRLKKYSATLETDDREQMKNLLREGNNVGIYLKCSERKKK